MTTLIERVAKAAGWEWWEIGDWCNSDGELMAYPPDTLEPAGLVFMLKELIAAKYEIKPYDHGVMIGKELANGYAASSGATLEEAVMLAYLSHKGER